MPNFAISGPTTTRLSANRAGMPTTTTSPTFRPTTIGMSLPEPAPPHSRSLISVRLSMLLVVPLGGGGLLSGLSTAIRGLGLKVHVIGVECAASTAFAVSLARGAITEIAPKRSIADGLVGNLESGSMTFDLVRRNVDRVVSVSEAELASAIRCLAEGDHLMAEGAGAAATAAVMARQVVSPGQRAVVVLSGSNIDLTTFTSAVSTAESLRGWADSVPGATTNRE